MMDKDAGKEEVSIRQYVFEARDNTTIDFDAKNEAQLTTTLMDFHKLLTVHLMVIGKGCDLGAGNHARYDAFALTKQVLDILTSALHMTRQRAFLETMCLLRVALECGSSALHISQDSEAYQRYEEGKYQPQREAIKFAKRYIPIMGELWGSLSEAAVHTNMRTYGPQINIDSEGNSIKSIVFQFNGREVKPIQDKLVLTLLSLVSLVILKISELIFFANSPSYKDALQLKGTNTIYFCNTDASINRYYDEFRSYIPMTK